VLSVALAVSIIIVSVCLRLIASMNTSNCSIEVVLVSMIAMIQLDEQRASWD
jgi:hypothetical protein